MRKTFILAAAAMLAYAAPSVAQPTQAPSTASTAVSARAVVLAGLYLQEDRAVARGLSEFDSNFDAGFSADPRSIDLEKQFPGLKAAAKAAGRKAFEEKYLGAIPEWKTAMATQFSTLFTASEIEQLISFFGSATGVKALNALADGANFDALREKAMKNPTDVSISATDLNNSVNIASLSVLSKEELKQFFDFSLSPIGKKLQANAPQIQGAMITAINGTLATVQGPIQQAIIDAVSTHIANAGKGQ